MSDTARKVFPMESVLALVLGKEDVDVKDLAGFLTGRSIACCCCARVVGPMAAGWLASLYPQFVALSWDQSTPWADFVSQYKKTTGDNVSVPPMNASLQALAAKTLDCLGDQQATIEAQKAEIAKMQARIDVLTPFEGKAGDLEKKCDQLEAKVKTMTTDMGGLRRDLLPFQGKMAVDQQELMTMIKDAIKDNLKGFVAGTAVGAAVVAGAEGAAAEEAPADNGGPAADFGFGASGSDSDGFGF